jgi:hypothetical protein
VLVMRALQRRFACVFKHRVPRRMRWLNNCREEVLNLTLKYTLPILLALSLSRRGRE